MSTNNIIIAAGPVIIENNKVLLVKHGTNPHWKFPGGRLAEFNFSDWSNSLEQTAKREAKEELGINIEIIKPLKTMFIPRENHKNEYVLLVHYLAKRQGEIRPGPEIDDWDWFPLDDLPDNCANNIKPVLASIND